MVLLDIHDKPTKLKNNIPIFVDNLELLINLLPSYK